MRVLKKIFVESKVVIEALGLMGVAPTALLAPAALGLLSTVLRLVTLLLFVPLIRGILVGNLARLDKFLPISDWLPVSGELSTYALLTVLILLAASARGLCDYAADLVLTQRIATAEGRLGEHVLQRFLGFGQQHYDLVRLGTAATKLQKLPTRAGNLLLFLHRSFLAVARLLIYFVAMVFLAWPLALAAAVVLAGYLIGFARLVVKVENTAADEEETEDRRSAAAYDLMLNLPLIKVCWTSDREVGRWRDVVESDSRNTLAQRRLLAMLDPLKEIFNILVLLGFVAACAFVLGAVGNADIAAYIIFFLIFRRAMGSFSPVQRIPAGWNRIIRQLTSLFSLLDDRDKYVVPSGTRRFSGRFAGIEFRDLEFAYKRKGQVLKGLSASIEPDRRTVIVGKTGSGKSTLFKLLLRLYDCPEGSILIGDEDIRSFELATLLPSIAYAESEPMLFNTTLRANVTYGLDGVADAALRTAAENAQAIDFIEGLEQGFDEPIGDQGRLLSHGEKQRLALMRVFLRPRADLVLLDEATSALDMHTEARIMRAFDEFAVGKTVVVITHRLPNLRSSDRVIVLRTGKVMETGDRDELLRGGGELATMWREQGLPIPAEPSH